VVRGSKVAIVDCGYPVTYQNILLGLAEIGITPSEVNYIIPTHVHLDHGGAAGHLLKEMRNAQVIAQERAIPHLADPSRLVESATRVFGKSAIETYGVPAPIPRERMTAVAEEMHLELGEGMTATLMHTPGHAPHQISFMLEKQKILITADAVGVIYPGTNTIIPTTPPPSLNPKTLLDTMERLSQFDPDSLLLPHFGVRGDPGMVFEGTRVRVTDWVEKIGRLRKEGLGFDAIVERMLGELTRETGKGVLPAYARVTARTSVMGITHYLEKTNA
jgi:glyoxylase-like metal-dependent hydrolase (beta-lactamase superfamily II)